MNVYIILFVPQTRYAEHYLKDTFSSHIIANSTSDAIKRFLQDGISVDDPMITNFLVTFIGEGLKSAPPNDIIFDNKMNAIVEDADDNLIYDYELEDPILLDFLNRHFEDLHYLLLHQDGPWFRVEKVENINNSVRRF